MSTPNASYSITIRLKIKKTGGNLSKVLGVIAEMGGDTAAIDNPPCEARDHVLRDITVNLSNSEQGDRLVERLKTMENVEFLNASDRTFLMHLGGKIHVEPNLPIKTRDDLSMIYTPGVARVCMAIHDDPSKVYALTIKGRMVAVITDGTRILALGPIGPEAGLPVMEGKAALFKSFAGVDAFPLPIDGAIDGLVNVIKQFAPDFDATDPKVQEKLRTEFLIMVAKAVSPAFGAINLEDIASPRCYDVEARLQKELDIPIFHDDQHGTAIVVLAATINAARLVKKQLRNMKVVVCGVGAAGMACSQLLIEAGVKNLIGFNVTGAVHTGRTDLTEQERWLAENSNPKGFKGTMEEALKGADMVLGLSVAGAIKPEWLKGMKKDAIVFALANPTPEVLPEDAAAYARVIATGGSNYPNQINNALVFPGIFRGALDARVRDITLEMQMEAARALAAVVTPRERNEEYIIPSVFDPRAHKAVADAVKRVAHNTGAARRAKKVE